MRALGLVLMLMALPAHGQDLTEVPESAPLPTSVATALQAALGADMGLDRVRMWQGDLSGDASPDLLVQAAFYFHAGGNAVILHQWVFESRGPDYVAGQDLALADGIKSARRDGPNLGLTLYVLLPDDPLCCPSGEKSVVVPLN